MSRPSNDEAYALFLRAIAVSNDPKPNKEALTMLERAVQLDPDYAPAWAALSGRLRYYGEFGEFSHERQAAIRRAEVAARRALSLDPELIDASTQLIFMTADTGKVGECYRIASALLARRPNSAEGHFGLGYALRYGGFLKESARECNRALSLDPTNIMFGTCALTFIEIGDYAAARRFLAIDPESAYSTSVSVYMPLRERNFAEVRRIADSGLINHREWWPLLDAVLRQRPVAEVDQVASRVKESTLRMPDPEHSYFNGLVFAACGRYNDALQLLRNAVDHNYCSYPAMDLEPAFAPVRNAPQFQAIRKDAIACHQRFPRFSS